MNYKTKTLELFLFVIVFAGFTFAQFGPKAVITPTSYDFGNIVQDSVVTFKFAITNEGDSELKITKVSASCGCTAVMPEKTELIPGESTNIIGSFDSKGKLGQQIKAVFIETNDPKNPKLLFRLTGNILEKWKYSE